MKPLLSIIIPTKDRYITLIPVLKAIYLDFKDKNVEFIIQDNTNDNLEVLQFLNDLNCEKIKYFHEPTSLPITQNCDLAIKNSIAKYVIMIGDDDYILPSITDAVLYMEKNEIECLNSNTADYYWPDLTFKFQTKASKSDSLMINKPIKKEFININPIDELNKVIKSGGTNFYNLPRLYHGIVKREVLDKIFDKCQTFFPGLSPDMANSSALAIFTKKFSIYNFPFSISGKSPKSAGGMGVNHKHTGDLNKKEFLDKKLLMHWDKKIPYFWTGDTIYAQSLFHSLKSCDYKGTINYNKLYAHLFIFERRSLLREMKPVKSSIISNPLNFLIIFYWSLYFFITRVFNYGLRNFFPQKKYIIYEKVNSIEKCVKKIEIINC
tara:strand:- start:346 stop:1482 length:1137 start_codon:yes stop_codon:yes gene_type:complete